MEFVKEADIAAPPEKVFSYLADFSKHPEWTTPGHKVTIEASSPGPTAVGSTFKSGAHQFGQQEDELKVTELTPNQRIVYEVRTNSGDTFRQVMELLPSGAGTRLLKRTEFLKRTLPSWLFMPVIMILAPKILAGDVERIKANMERPAPV